MTTISATMSWMICAIITSCTHIREPYDAQGTGVAQQSGRGGESAAAVPAVRVGEGGLRQQIIRGKRMIDSAIMKANMLRDPAPLVETRMYFESLLGNSQDQSLIHYYIGYCSYHASLAMRENDQDMAEELIDNALEALEQSLEENRSFADGWALLSNVYGLKASFGGFAGMTYGPKSGAAIKKAQGLEPENPRVVLVAGTGKFYTPEAFGGDKEEALQLFKKAAAIFDAQNKEETEQPSWGHEEAYTYIGITLMEKGDLAGARAAFEHVLEINPEFGWVKHVLLPGLAEQEKK